MNVLCLCFYTKQQVKTFTMYLFESNKKKVKKKTGRKETKKRKRPKYKGAGDNGAAISIQNIYNWDVPWTFIFSCKNMGTQV